MNKSTLAVVLGLALAAAPAAEAAKFKLINLDPAGVGLNDTTPTAPIGGNPGTTRGAQARVVYQFAMDMWGGVLESSQDINVRASFAPLTCSATTGTLAQAGAWDIWLLNFADRSRVVGSPLAEALIGENLSDPNDPGDINTAFNGKLGQPDCLAGMSWYFGLDGKTPAGQVNFLNVVMHEIGHGLGAQAFINVSSGAYAYGYSDLYTYNAYDNVLNRTFESMTNAQRQTAMRTPGRTVWRGGGVNYEAGLVLTPGEFSYLQVSAPAALAGRNFEVGTAAFGPAATAATFPDGKLVLINDGDTAGGGTTSDGCSANGGSTGLGDTITYTNQAEVAGNIAVIDRGTCSFEYKAKIAQDNGAVAVIIANNAAGPAAGMAAVDPSTGVSIPTVMVSQTDGNLIKANIAEARAGMKLVSENQGVDSAGRVRLYVPATVAPGSTFSHFDTTLNPDALMEPFDSESVQANYTVDLTSALFWDMLWDLNPNNGKFADCDTGLRAIDDGGIALGSNLQAASNMCKTTSSTRNVYTTCMYKHRDSMLADAAITSKEAQKVNTCIKKMSDNYNRY